jgi:hypothetical protein
MNLNELLITWLCLIDHLSPLVREDQRLCERGCLLGRRCCRMPSGHTGYGSGRTAAIAGWHPRRSGCGWRRSLFRAHRGVGGPVARRGQAADRCLRHYQGAAIHHDPPRSTSYAASVVHCLPYLVFTWSSMLAGQKYAPGNGLLREPEREDFHGSIDRPSHDPGWRPGALPGSGTPTPAPISAEAPMLADLARHSKRRLPPGPRWTAQPYRCPRRPPCVAVAGTQASQSITSASQFVASGEIAARIRAMGDGKSTVLGAIASLYLNRS